MGKFERIWVFISGKGSDKIRIQLGGIVGSTLILGQSKAGLAPVGFGFNGNVNSSAFHPFC